MSKKRIVPIIALLGVFVASMMIVFTGTVKTSDVYADVYADVTLSAEIRDTYLLNDEFNVPSGVIHYEDQDYDADETYLVSPSGNVYGSSSCVLSQIGTYKLKYIKKINGVNVIAEREFRVVKNYYTFENTDNKSSNEKFAQLSYSNQLSMVKDMEISGISATIPSGVELNINEAFDLSELGNNTPIITIYPYNNTYLNGRNGDIEAYDIIVKLTDCNDVNNFIEVNYHWCIRQEAVLPHLYYKAGANGSETTSMDPCSESDVAAFEYKGKYYKKRTAGLGMYSLIDRSDWYGRKDAQGNVTPYTTAEKATYFTDHENYARSSGFSFYYDDDALEVKCGEVLGVKNNSTSVQTPRLVAHMSESSLYGDKAFTGFTSDRVYLSIRAEQYKANNAFNTEGVAVLNLEIADIFGQSGIELNKLVNTAMDTVKPYIVVDGMENENEVCSVKRGAQIIVPDYTAYDLYFKSSKVSAYYNYGLENQSVVAINNNKFVAEKVGLYAVEYACEDTSGNISKRIIYITSKDIIGDTVSLTVNPPASCYAGADVALPAAEISGDNVNRKYEVYFKFGSGDYTLIKDDSFFVEHVGEYTLRYVYGDLVQEKVEEFTLNAQSSDNVTFDDYHLPAYFIKNATYTIDRINCYTYKSESPKTEQANVYVSEDGGEFAAVSSDAYKVGASSTVRVKYEFDNKSIISETINVIDVNYNDEEISLNKEKYFVTEGDIAVSASADGIAFTGETADKKSIKYINSLSLKNFVLECSVPQDHHDFKSLEFTFIDYYNRSNKVYMTISVSTGNNSTIAIGESRAWPSINFNGDLFRIRYSSGQIFINDSHVNFGSEFTTDSFLLEIGFLNIGYNRETNSADSTKTKSGITIKTLNNAIMNDLTQNRTSAQIVVPDFPVQMETGSTVTVYKAEVLDAFVPYCVNNLQLTVKGPNGQYVDAADGTKLDENCDATKEYQFVMSQKGQYIVEYRYDNGFALRPTVIRNIINTKKTVAPTIELADGVKNGDVFTASAGTVHKIKDYQLSDDSDIIKDVNDPNNKQAMFGILIMSADGQMYVTDSDTVTLNVVGEWRIIYRCIDSDGNFTMVYYIVNVK